jgi:quinoprotein glucose dehydrogenase
MRSTFTLRAIVIILAILAQSLSAQPKGKQAKSTPAGDWPMYGHDLAGTRYSPLTQISTGNVSKLAQAWTYKLASDAPAAANVKGKGGGAGPPSEATPIVVNGVMYVTGTNRVVALDPETGQEIWRYAVTGAAPSRRGVSYWPGDQNNAARIFVTSGRRLIALNASSGKIDPGFGKEGEVDMAVPYNSIPTIFRNALIVGANPGQAQAGDSRAYDVRTGQKLWDFHSVPLPGEAGHDTWAGDSWKGRSGVNAWVFYQTVDQDRGIVYMSFAAPAAYYYGGDRKGTNLFGNSIVAADATTGKYLWHFQTIHHDIWDHDPPAPPGLIEITRNGRRIPALAQVTKSGYMYILDRVSGKPVFGVEERAVAKSDVPGEESWPTQPIPMKPPPLARVSFKTEDLVTAEDTTPEHAKACRELMEKNGGLYNAGPFTPFMFHAEGAPVKSSVVFPGGLGGANWGGTAYDPRSGYVFVNTQDNGALGFVERTKEGAASPYDKATLDGPGPGRGNFDVRVPGASVNWPCQKPPWGHLTAVNANTGDIAWQVRLGITEDLPEGKRNTGRGGVSGAAVTAGGLVFIGATNDNRFRAFDAKTGKELWSVKLDRIANANPMVYQGKSGKQYVAVAATDTLLAFALP